MNFDELMECYHISDFDSNRVTYNELLQMFRRGNITPVIGAGLSSWAYPLWGEMLKGLAKDYGMESDIEELLNNNQYDVAASSLEKELSTNGFRSLLQKIFHISLLEVKKEECPVYLRNIPRLFHGPIVTTNFDRMIEYLFELDKNIVLTWLFQRTIYKTTKLIVPYIIRNLFWLKCTGILKIQQTLF